MKKNIRYNIVLLLLMVEAVLIPAFAQMPEIKLGQSISFEEYLNRVAKKNLSYLAEKLNVSIADAEERHETNLSANYNNANQRNYNSDKIQ